MGPATPPHPRPPTVVFHPFSRVRPVRKRKKLAVKDQADLVAVTGVLKRAAACARSEAECQRVMGTFQTHHSIASNAWLGDIRNAALTYKPTGAEDDGEGEDDVDGECAVLTPKRVKKMKVSQLKAALSERGARTSGLKLVPPDG